MKTTRPKQYKTDCEGCERTIKQQIPRTDQDNYPGVRIRCAVCRTINWVPEADG